MKFFQLVPTTTNFDFIGKFPWFVALSIFTVGAVIVGTFTKGFNFGIDFTGGTVVQVKFAEKTAPDVARAIVDKAGAPDATVVSADKAGFDYMITARTVVQAGNTLTFDKKLIEAAGPGKLTIQQIDVVGPKVGSELKKAAVESLVYSVLLIMVYIWFRFDFRFAPGATVAMIHDIILAAGFYLFTGREFSITSVAALLTIAGYSVNDTIVIYDRVREMIKMGGDQMPLAQTINKAINLTLSRTLLTALVTLVSVIPIIFFCSGEIADFAEAMAVGIFVGCYSTIYIAAPFTVLVERYAAKKGTGRRPVTA